MYLHIFPLHGILAFMIFCSFSTISFHFYVVRNIWKHGSTNVLRTMCSCFLDLMHARVLVWSQLPYFWWEGAIAPSFIIPTIPKNTTTPMDDVATPTYIAPVKLPVASREEVRQRQKKRGERHKKSLNRGRKKVKRENKRELPILQSRLVS